MNSQKSYEFTDIQQIHRNHTNLQTSYEFTDIIRIHRPQQSCKKLSFLHHVGLRGISEFIHIFPISLPRAKNLFFCDHPVASRVGNMVSYPPHFVEPHVEGKIETLSDVAIYRKGHPAVIPELEG